MCLVLSFQRPFVGSEALARSQLGRHTDYYNNILVKICQVLYTNFIQKFWGSFLKDYSPCQVSSQPGICLTVSYCSFALLISSFRARTLALSDSSSLSFHIA